jgi:U3 small nucleolar RNA-associated protein 20
MEQVQEMMLTSNTTQIRNLCSNIFVQFLLEYPLQNERIESHMHFMLKNLSYKQSENRIHLLTTLQTLIERFPAQVVDLYCELMFFTLLLRVVNDENPRCREEVLKTMKILVTGDKIS